MTDSINTVLVLAPHPDDGEFACGAALHRFTSEGKAVWYAAFSPCLQSLPEAAAPDTLFQELAEATGILGIPKEQVLTFNVPVRHFPAHRQDILENLIALRKRIQPDLVLIPNSKDVHQDHQVIHQEGVRAFKHSCLAGYELPWNSFGFDNSFYVKVSEENLQQKLAAIRAYKTQQFRGYASDDLFTGLARTRGMQVNAPYAEAFEMIRWIV